MLLYGCNTAVLPFREANSADKKLQLLSNLLETPGASRENRFILVNQIISILQSRGETTQANVFLQKQSTLHPEDPFNGYYLFLIAENHKNNNAAPLAAYYYKIVLNNYTDLLVRGTSVHYIALTNLCEIISDPEELAAYYKSLISRFPSEINQGLIYYRLAKSYEKTGQWKQSIQACKHFLKFPETIVPENPKAREEARELVLYNNMNITWSRSDLSNIMNSIVVAIRNRDVWALQKYRTKVNFFTVAWEHRESQEINLANTESIRFIISSSSLNSGNIHFSQDIEYNSDGSEAYIKSLNWPRIRTWYFYFRKIHYPLNPEINGNWEWAGVYFGERL